MSKKNGAAVADAPSRSTISSVALAQLFSVQRRTATLYIESAGPLEWSKKIPKCPSNVDQISHEEANWRGRFHQDGDDAVFPTEALKKSLESACSGVKIPGKGNATYAKVLRQGVRALKPFASLGAKVSDLKPMWAFVPGSPGSGSETRVDKCFPILDSWKSEVEFLIIDPILTPEVLQAIAQRAGLMIGIGAYRGENGGPFGSFKVNKIIWQ